MFCRETGDPRNNGVSYYRTIDLLNVEVFSPIALRTTASTRLKSRVQSVPFTFHSTFSIPSFFIIALHFDE
jgi:hypothetical protein